MKNNQTSLRFQSMFWIIKLHQFISHLRLASKKQRQENYVLKCKFIQSCSLIFSIYIILKFQKLKLAVAGSQVVGLVPLKVMLDAAEYYINKEDLFIVEEDQKLRLVGKYIKIL